MLISKSDSKADTQPLSWWFFFFRSNCAKNTVDKPYWYFIRDRTNEYPTLLSFHLPFQEHFVGNSTTNLHGYCKTGKEPEGLTVDGLLSLSNGVETEDSESFPQYVVAVKTRFRTVLICRERVGEEGTKLLGIFPQVPRSETQFVKDVQMGSSQTRRHRKPPVGNTRTAVHLVFCWFREEMHPMTTYVLETEKQHKNVE